MNWVCRVDDEGNQLALKIIKDSPLKDIMDMAGLTQRIVARKIDPEEKNNEDAVFLALKEYVDFARDPLGKKVLEDGLSFESVLQNKNHAEMDHLYNNFCNAVGDLYVSQLHLDLTAEDADEIIKDRQIEKLIKNNRAQFIRDHLSTDIGKYEKMRGAFEPGADPAQANAMDKWEVMEMDAHSAGYAIAAEFLEKIQPDLLKIPGRSAADQ